MSRYRINSPKVIHQIFESEVVVVNLETGSYYSVEGAGIDIWRLLGECRDTAEVEAFVSDGANGKAVANATAVRRFIEQLSDESLIVPDEGVVPAGPKRELPGNMTKFANNPPLLRKFTDMQDLLLLDPIHELDEAGWPQRNQSAGA